MFSLFNRCFHYSTRLLNRTDVAKIRLMLRHTYNVSFHDLIQIDPFALAYGKVQTKTLNCFVPHSGCLCNLYT